MDIKQLKEKIITNQIDDTPLILKYSDNKYICYQYAAEIAKNRGLNLVYISQLSDITNDDELFDVENDSLYIYDIEKLKENITFENRNVIVITKTVPDNLSTDYIEIPNLIAWQIEDFVKFRLPGLSAEQVKWLCDVTKNDIFRIDQECRKIEIFPESMQKIIFDQLNQENAYCDLNSLTIFNFTNAVMKKDLVTVHAVLADLKWIDIEGSGLITIFHKQFKNVIDIQLNPKATAATLGMNPKQFNAIRYNCGKYTSDELINIFEFLTELDMRLKSGDYQFKNDVKENNAKFVEYITMNILALGHAK